MNYYYVVNKGENDNKKLYLSFENIIKSGAILCRQRSGIKKDFATFNGDEYISLAYYVKQSEYKVPKVSCKEFLQSNLNKIFKNYREYLNYLKLDTFIKTPISWQDFFKQNPNKTKKDYYRYLDKISRKYPINLKIFFKNVKKDEIINEIFKKFNKNSKIEDVGYSYANENAYYKYIKNADGIVFVIDDKIKTEKTILIPNLESDFFSLKWQNKIAASKSVRYTNLIGEVQVKDAIPLKNVKYIVVSSTIEKEKLKNIMKKYKIKINLKTKY